MAAKKILMLVGDFVEDYEAMVPFQMLTMVGHTVQNSIYFLYGHLFLLTLPPKTSPVGMLGFSV